MEHADAGHGSGTETTGPPREVTVNQAVAWNLAWLRRAAGAMIPVSLTHGRGRFGATLPHRSRCRETEENPIDDPAGRSAP